MNMFFLRLQDIYGNGPYASEAARGHMAEPLTPYAMLESVGLNPRQFKKLCAKGWKFAWLDESHMLDSIGVGYADLARLGYYRVEVRPWRFKVFPDGQVFYSPRNRPASKRIATGKVDYKSNLA